MTEHESALDLARRVLGDAHADPDDDLSLLARQFLRAVEKIAMLRARDGALETADKWISDSARREGQMRAEIEQLRAALLPFAAAAGRPGRLLDSMTDQPLPDDAVLGLGVKVSAWKRAAELTGA